MHNLGRQSQETEIAPNPVCCNFEHPGFHIHQMKNDLELLSTLTLPPLTTSMLNNTSTVDIRSFAYYHVTIRYVFLAHFPFSNVTTSVGFTSNILLYWSIAHTPLRCRASLSFCCTFRFGVIRQVCLLRTKFPWRSSRALLILFSSFTLPVRCLSHVLVIVQCSRDRVDQRLLKTIRTYKINLFTSNRPIHC